MGLTRATRGRDASSPSEIPLVGWRDVLLRVMHEAKLDNLTLIAAGMAFYAMLSVAPTLAVMVSLYGLLVSPEQVQAQIELLSSYLPPDAAATVLTQMQGVATAEQASLGWGMALAALISLWSASKAMKSLFGGLNTVYEEYETRSFLVVSAQSLFFTLAGIVMLVLMLSVVALLPVLLDVLALPGSRELMVRVLSWLVIAGVALVALAVLYRYGPSRSKPQWQWVTVGALFALVIWLASSMALSWYVASFDSYQRTYGSLGAVVVLLMWFFLSAYAVLLGGELNSELEHQTEIDSTVGAPQPMGQRGAKVADTLGGIPSWRSPGGRPATTLPANTLSDSSLS